MRQKFTRWLSLLTVCCMLAVYCTTAQAALLDVGPTVPPVIGSTEPNLGHGFPLWYRDTNRLPLELCTNEAMCFFARPNPLAPVSFPANMPDEVFFYAAAANIDLPLIGGKAQKALLFLAVEGNIVDVPGAPPSLVSFARLRVRVDTPTAGLYTVTTPYKQLRFTIANNATDIAAGINFTEDIGIGANGVFTGALAGSVGPFLYCTGLPVPATDGTGGLYIGKNAVNCLVEGSTFPDPKNPAQFTNLFRVEGPVGFTAVQTNQFSVQGKIYEGAIPTPLTVDRATYTLDAAGMQVTVFSTTQILSNQTVGGLTFPGRFALTGVPSTLQLSGAGIPVQALMTTNNPADGKFFSASGLFTAPATVPNLVTVTNAADIPIPGTSKEVPLVDEVVITEASFAPIATGGGTLRVVAVSGDKLALPILTVSMKDGQLDVPLGTIAGGSGVLSVTFPFTPLGGTKIYNIPPESITVTSAKLGSDTELVTNPLSLPPVPPVAANDAENVAPGGTVIINVAANDTTPVAGGTVVSTSVAIVTGATKGTAVKNADGTITYTQLPASSGTDSFTYTIRDNAGVVSNVATVTVTISNSTPVANPFTVTTNEDTPVTFNVAANATDPDTALNLLNAVDPATLLVTQPLNGTVSAPVNGSVSYTPKPNYNGPDSFQYSVRDTLGALSNTATVSITVTPVAEAPLTVNDTAITAQNSLGVSIDVLFNDSHPDVAQGIAIVPATLAIVTPPAISVGTATVVAGQLFFKPALNFSGIATFNYIVSDNAVPSRPSAPATVTVTVTPVNIAPTANPDVATTFVNTPRIINLTANDTDADGTIIPATVVIVNPPANASAFTNNLNGTVTYTSAIAGTDSFTYTVSDNAGASSNAATVTVSVASVTVITDAISMNKAQFTASTRQWNVEGSTTNATAGTLVTIRVGSGITGQIIGTAPVATDGRWKFQLGGNPGNVGPDANNTISVTLPSGASRLAFPIAVR